MFIVSCSEVQSPKTSFPPVTVADVNARYCPEGAAQIKLDVTTTELEREQNIPLNYQGYNNIEGPVWHDGALYYSNMGSYLPDENGFVLTNQAVIWRWERGQKPQLWMDDIAAGTNGLALDSQGNLIAARQLDGSLVTIDWKSKKITTIANGFNGQRFNSPNDLTIAYDNSIYFTDPNWNTPSNINPATTQGGGPAGSTEPGQRIYRVTHDGTVNATGVSDLVPALRDKPNGITLSLDQQQLIVGGLQGLWVFDLTAGKVSNPQQILDSPVDGLGKDCSGNIYITTTTRVGSRTDGQIVLIIDKEYQKIGQINVEGIHIVTNVAFGGKDRKTLFVTGLTDPMNGDALRYCGDSLCLSAGIYSVKLNVPGFPY
jgi:gluconolactonase